MGEAWVGYLECISFLGISEISKIEDEKVYQD
jgi:hypothetical protein